MDGLSPGVILVIAAFFGLYLLVHDAVVGVKKVVHGTKTAIHHVLHPHQDEAGK